MDLNLINILSLVLTTLSLFIAILQTVRINNLRTVRDSHFQLIWLKAKELSRVLYESRENELNQKELFVRAQRLEENIALLIVNVGRFNARKIEKLKFQGIIDKYDFNLLKRLIHPLK